MNAGYIYVIAFDNGTVKVGRTGDKKVRLNAHKSDARRYGLTVTNSWVSPLHTEWHANEDALKKIAAGLGGTPLKAEYFSGVSFAAVADQAAGLTFTPPPASEAATVAATVPAPATLPSRIEYAVDTDIWEILDMLNEVGALTPSFGLADILQAFTDAIKRREGEFASCPACREDAGGACADHAEDARLAHVYHAARSIFAAAPRSEEAYKAVTEAVRPGTGKADMFPVLPLTAGKAAVYTGIPLAGGKVLVRRDAA
jgi:hypothetical protein